VVRVSQLDVLVPPASVGPVATLAQPPAERRVVVAVMACTVLVELAGQLLGTKGSVQIGRIPVSVALAPGLVTIAAVGPRRLLGHRGWTAPPAGFWTAGLVALVSASFVYVRAFDRWVDVGGLAAAAFTEEIVYRLAAPIFCAALLVRLGVRVRSARAVGFVAAGVWWSFLPGHVGQMDGPVAVASFAAAGLLFGLVVVRSGSVLAATLVHVVMNLLAFTDWAGELGPHDRRLLVAALLGLFVFTFGRPQRQPATDADTVIDLRDDATVLDLTELERPGATAGDRSLRVR